VIDMRWKRKLGSRLSPEIDAILRPSSEKKAIAIIMIMIIIKSERHGNVIV